MAYPKISRDLSRARAVGHICGHHFDAAGRQIAHELCQRIMFVPLERLKDIPTFAGVACGPFKARAISGALHWSLRRRSYYRHWSGAGCPERDRRNSGMTVNLTHAASAGLPFPDVKYAR